MQALDNYISERLNPRNLGFSVHKFPINDEPEKMIKFLQDFGFTETQVQSLRNSKYAQAYDKSKGKCYSVVFYSKDSYASILFADTTKGNISDENPMYIIIFYLGKVSTIIRYSSESSETKMKLEDFVAETKMYFKK